MKKKDELEIDDFHGALVKIMEENKKKGIKK